MPSQHDPSPPEGGRAPTPAPSSTPVALPPVLPPSPCGCGDDPIEGLKRLFVDYFQGKGMAAGRDPATRPVFLRLHGVAHARFVINPDLPAELRVGVFAQAPEYSAWVRFSSDVQPGVPDRKGTVGVGLKLFGVGGEKLLEPDQDASTHDFIFQNHDVFFTDTARDMCEFTCQSLHGQGEAYLAQHPRTKTILDAMAKEVPSALGTPYWSVLPFRFGDGRHVKYKLEPLDPLETATPATSATPAPSAAPSAPLAPPDYNDPFYLRADLRARLRRGEARFKFMVQFQTDAQAMPLDAATVPWSETASPPVHVATLIVPAQDLDARGQSAYGENLAYNTWHALPEHGPVGSLAEARKIAYRASAENRRNVNGVPLGEPAAPRPPQYAPGVDYPAGDARDARIVRAAIHPAIGVARVGNSADEFFLAPQVADPPPRPVGSYRDAAGGLKREAAQFRIYGYNAAGEVVRELTADGADITWTVHVANRKAAWYQWQIALDIPEASTTVLPRRNAKFAPRDALAIDPGPRSIGGRGGAPVACAGEFTGVPVALGELRTDDRGRLLFLGGHGVSASPSGTPIYRPDDDDSFINADGWYDDTCDGPVSAKVTIEGRDVPVESAWVVTAPPNYAPQLKAERTMYDLLYDLYVQAGWLPAPTVISFARDVYPILHRLSALQWVNQGFATQFGHGGRYDFEDPDFVARLARQPPAGDYDPEAEVRRQVLNSFRPPVAADGNQLPWPWLYGDAMSVPAGNSPRQNASITATQYATLRRWAAGDFKADWGDARPDQTDIDRLPLAEQPAMLDRAALEFCLADAFHPGCELTWPMRHLSLYRAPFRIRERPADAPAPNYGPTLDQAAALAPTGPLHAQGPGDLTRWMGLPWQADTAYCRAGYEANYDPFAPTFWPARVPNHVLTAHDYDLVVDQKVPPQRRVDAFSQRTSWNKPLHGDVAQQMVQMVRMFGSMGLVEVRPGVPDDAALPKTMMVASYGPDVAPADARSAEPEAPTALKAAAGAVAPAAREAAAGAVAPSALEAEADAMAPSARKASPGAAAPARGKAKARPLPRGANFESHEHAKAAPLPVRIKRP